MPPKIFHVSDIHIVSRNYVNIKFSFAQLMDAIIKVNGYKKNCILVIAGDVFDTKTHITTDDIELFNKIMGNLDKFGIRTIIIPGNHDYNVNSKCKMDNISVLLQKTSYENIICYSETGVYVKWGVEFHIFSPIDKKIPENKKSRRFKVAVLHETVKSATFDNGIVVEESRFNKTFLSTSYDIVLLGDIHKPQFLCKNVGYSGSFVQKNKGEGIYHGYILWNLRTRKGEHIYLKLKEVYLTINAKNNTYESLPNVIPRYIQIRYTNCSNEWITDLSHKIKKRYGKSVNLIIDTDKVYYVDDGKIEKKESAEVVRKTISNTLNQIELITKKLKENKKSNTFIKKVIEYHNKNITKKRNTVYTRWSLNYLAWNNMFCYGNDNYINFHAMNGLISILGENKIGKSSIIDLLFLVLFNKTYRGGMMDIVNKRFRSGSVKCGFSVGDDMYVIEQWIERVGKKKHHRLYKNDKNITKVTIDKTYKYMSDELGIGLPGEFVKTSLALQNRTFLIDLSRKERYDHFCKQLDIDVFDEIEKTCVVDKKSLEVGIKESKRNSDFDIDVKKIQEEIKDNKKKIEDIDKDLENAKKILALKRADREEQLKYYNPDKKQEQLQRELENLRKMIHAVKKKRVNKLKNSETLREKEISIKKLEEKYNIIKGKFSTVGIGIKNTESLTDLEKKLSKLGREVECKESREKLLIRRKKLEFLLNGKEYEKTNTEQLKIEISLAEERIKRINVPPVKINYDQLTQLLKEKHDLEQTPDIDTKKLYKKLVIVKEDMNEIKKILNGMDFYKIDGKVDDLIEKLQNNYSFNGFEFDSTCKCCINNKKVKEKYGEWSKKKKLIKKLHAWKKYITLKNNSDVKRQINEAEKKNKRKKNRIEFILNQALGCEKLGLINRLDEDKSELKMQNAWNELTNVNTLLKIIDNNKKITTERVKINKYISYIKAKKYISQLDDLKKKIDSEREVYTECKKIENIITSREKYIELEKIITANAKISELKPVITYTENKIDSFNTERAKLMVKIENMKNKIRNKDKLDKLLSDKIEQLSVVKSYLQCIDKKKGIPSLVLTSACDILNKKCNQMLSHITDFNVRFCYSPVKGISISTSKILDSITYYISADMASGFQKFIIDVVMRVVFARITRCSTPEVMFIDEGFGCLDKTNFSTVCDTLKHFSKCFKSIFIISHIEEIQAYMNSSIKIDLNKDLTSCVKVGEVDTKIRLIDETLSDRKKANRAQEKVLTSHQKLKKRIERETPKEKKKPEEILDKSIMDIFEEGGERRKCKACNKTIKFTAYFAKRHVNGKIHKANMEKYLSEQKTP